MLPPPSSQSTTRAPRWFAWIGVFALAVYAVFLGLNSTVAAGGSDSSGYLNSGRLLAAGHLDTPVRLPAGFASSTETTPTHFSPLGFWFRAAESRLVPNYPSGLPLHLAAVGKVFGWSWSPLLVQLAGAVAAVWLCYMVARELGLDWPLAAAAAVALAACPVMLFASIQPLSDLLATTWCLAAVWAALRARRVFGWAVACGAAYGVAMLVRPTNIVLLPALLVLLGLHWRRLAFAALGGLPAAAWLACYNHALYGGALQSGYGSGWSQFFAASYFQPTAVHFLHFLAVFVPTFLLVLPLAAFWRRDTRTRELFALALWFWAITGLYLFCAFSGEAWMCLRYILPAIPALILAGLLGVEALARSLVAARADRFRRVAASLLAVWAVGVSWFWSPRHAMFQIRHYEDAYQTSSTATRSYFPASTLMLCCQTSGAVYYYTDFPILRWDALNAAQFARYAALAQGAGVTLGALLFPGEEERALRENCPGNWQRVTTVDGLSLWRLLPPSTPGALK